MPRYARPPEQQRWYDPVAVERVLQNWVARRAYSFGLGRYLSDVERRVLLAVLTGAGMTPTHAKQFLAMNNIVTARVLSSSNRDGGARVRDRRIRAAARYLRAVGEQRLHEEAPPVLTGAQYRSIIAASAGAPENWRETTHAIYAAAHYTGN